MPVASSLIKEYLMVHAKGEASMQGAPGVHLGTVDHIDGEKYIKLTKSDSPDGQQQWIPVNWVGCGGWQARLRTSL